MLHASLITALRVSSRAERWPNSALLIKTPSGAPLRVGWSTIPGTRYTSGMLKWGCDEGESTSKIGVQSLQSIKRCVIECGIINTCEYTLRAASKIRTVLRFMRNNG
jgi:hypothetical protein